MSFGFGFGLPHHVAILGGGGPPATVYFLSVTTSTNTEPYSIVVDSSGNIELFGYNITGDFGLAAKLTSSGTKSLFEGIGTGGNGVALGSIDSVDNIYITYVVFDGFSYYPVIVKTNTSFGVVASTAINFGGNAGAHSEATVDNSGNVWVTTTDSYFNYLLKANSTLTSASVYTASYVCCAYSIVPLGLTLAPSGDLVIRGGYYSPVCCTYIPSPIVQSITTSGVLNWTQYISSLFGNGGVKSLAVDSSGNIYFTVNNQNLLIKLNSSGAVQWTNNAKQYTGISVIKSIAVDSSGNVYCVGTSTTSSVLEIIKVNSSGVLQFSRKLSVTSGGNLDVNNPSITVKNDVMYIATGTIAPAIVGTEKATVLKVPTDGTLTQTIVVGSITYGYAVGSVTSSNFAITGSLTTNYPYSSATGQPLLAHTPAISNVTATTAVTPL